MDKEKYCVHGKTVEHAVSAGITCIGPFVRSKYDPAIIESERPD